MLLLGKVFARPPSPAQLALRGATLLAGAALIVFAGALHVVFTVRRALPW